MAVTPIPAPITVGQSVPVTGIGRGEVCRVGRAEAVAVEVGVALTDAVGAAVAVAVGEGDAHSVRSVVQEAPSDGQQYLCVPQALITPTSDAERQLRLCGVPSAFDGLQLISRSG